MPGACKRELELNDLWKKRLWSYYHLIQGNKKMSSDNRVDLFLDSGAFSAFTQGVEIDIDEYIDFIKEHKNHLEVYANLDAIGDPVKTLENQRYMEEAGLSPLPCFHYGEDTGFLETYIDEYDYVALGGMVPISTPDLQKWLDDIFSKFICDDNGYPKVKIHGFGLTSLRLMLRYPWFSVDSTSWVVTGRMGSVFVPRFRSGEWIYGEDSWKIAVSSRSPTKKEKGRHIDTLSPMNKQTILDYFTDKGYILGRSEFHVVEKPKEYELLDNERWCGKEREDGSREVETMVVQGLSNDYRLRDELNIIYFLDLEKNMPDWPWAFKVVKKSSGFGM